MRRQRPGFLERCASELPIWFVAAVAGAAFGVTTVGAACVAAGVYLLLTVLATTRRERRARQLDEQRDHLVSDDRTDTVTRH